MSPLFRELDLILTPLQITNPSLFPPYNRLNIDISTINNQQIQNKCSEKHDSLDKSPTRQILFFDDSLPTTRYMHILTPLQVNPNLIPHIATKHDISIKDKHRNKWRLHKRLTRSRITGMQDNKDLRLILTSLQIPSTDISITTTTFPMAPLPCIFRHIFDDHHSPILDIRNMPEICAFCNAKMWNGEKLSKSSCRNIQFSTCCLNGKSIFYATGVPNISLNLKSTPSFDVRYRNKPTPSEIAILLPGYGSDHIAHRDIILKTLCGPLRRINELHS
ncbi:uncharacterized protein LOC135930229 [Gordionus sp. m RMFG-2023]|uniref:uncharacterized protein LOC135930229 n=1 Tax=Gordionus sp. m RMFG-2023 TaxID=3053472 RepID=UPI0031FBFAB2